MTEISVDLRPAVYILRGGVDFRFGDKYEFSCIVHRLRTHAFIEGMQGKLENGVREAIGKALYKEGFISASWYDAEGREFFQNLTCYEQTS